MRGGNVLSYIIGTDRHLAMTSVNQYGKLNLCGSAECYKRVQCRANRPSRTHYVIGQNNRFSVYVTRHLTGVGSVAHIFVNIIAKRRNIKRSDGNFYRIVNPCIYALGKPIRKRNSSCLYPDKHNIVKPVISLGNLMSNTNHSPSESFFIK